MSLLAKLNNFIKLFNQIDISFNEKTNSFIVKTQANLVVNTNQNILLISEGDTFIVSNTLHLNPTINFVKEKHPEAMSLLGESLGN